MVRSRCSPPGTTPSRLPAGTVNTLLKPENSGMLTNVVTYHLVPGRLTAGRSPNLQNAAAGQLSTSPVRDGRL